MMFLRNLCVVLLSGERMVDIRMDVPWLEVASASWDSEYACLAITPSFVPLYSTRGA